MAARRAEDCLTQFDLTIFIVFLASLGRWKVIIKTGEMIPSRWNDARVSGMTDEVIGDVVKGMFENLSWVESLTVRKAAEAAQALYAAIWGVALPTDTWVALMKDLFSNEGRLTSEEVRKYGGTGQIIDDRRGSGLVGPLVENPILLPGVV